MRPAAGKSKSVGHRKTLKGTEESRASEPDATTGLCFKDAQESVLDSFAFANAAARDEIEALCSSLVRNAISTFRPASGIIPAAVELGKEALPTLSR